MQCPLFDGGIGDKTVHILTHFIRRTEPALREYLRNYLLARLEWFSQISLEYLEAVQMSAEEYIDYISSPGSPIDILGLFLIARLYEIHIGVMFKSGYWTTCSSERLKDCMIVLIYNGIYSFSETCAINAEQSYMSSITEKTKEGLMPSHQRDLKITLDEEEPSTSTTTSTGTERKDIKPKVKAEPKLELAFSKPANVKLNSQYSMARNLLAKARKDYGQIDSKKRLKHIVSAAIQSGQLNVKEIASKARQSQQKRAMICELCAKPFPSLRSYLKHFKDDHPGGRFLCQYCTKQYTSWSGRYKHEKLHTDSAKRIICMICGRGFHYQNELEKHMPVHDPDRKHSCVDCGKTFASKGTLNRHAASHLNLHFPCTGLDKSGQNCTSSFNTKEKLQRHFRGSHGDGYTTLCLKYTFSWPGKRQRHQANCSDCAKVREERESKRYPSLRSS